VFKLNPAGKETVLHSFDVRSDGAVPLGGSLLRDSAGNLYGTAAGGGSQGAGTVFKLDRNGTFTVLHSFPGNGTDGDNPFGTLVRDAEGNLYGVTLFGGAFNYGTVFKVDTTNTETVLYSFSGTGGDGVIPAGVVRDRSGNLYGTTSGGGGSFFGTVFRLDAGGAETILHSFLGTDGRFPELGLVQDSKGNLYGTAQYGGKYGGGVVFKVTP
jgi:uncharacterized repeat protein (TIGR03803 family)